MSDHLSKADSHLYGGVRKPKNAKREISSSTTLAFTSQLSSLLSSSDPNSSSSTRGRVRPSSNKSDLFTAHNKNSKKRALKDLESDIPSKISRPSLDAIDPASLHRSKRKMEEKARIYAAMKRGDYVAGDNEPEQLIDFDRKWAENEARGKGNELDTSSDDGGDSEDGGEEELVEYQDQYGRMRTGTKADAERMSRKKRNALLGAEELDRLSARPAQPTELIYGDTVQTSAFNPDDITTEKMEEIAAKRDRSMTPPDAKHYEADKEIRSKGVGFFAFSKDEGIREKEMEALERERRETERIRGQREERKEERKREVEKRRKEIAERRAGKKAEAFLERLESDIVGQGDENGDEG